MLELVMINLAGKLGVEITEKLLDRQFIILEDGEYIVTEQGKQWFLNFGINVDEADTKGGYLQNLALIGVNDATILPVG